MSKHKLSAVDGVLAGLGRLTINAKSGAASKEAKRVVAAFIRGEKAQGSCRVGSMPKDCGITANGAQLRVGEYVLATKTARGLEVCVPPQGTVIKAGRKVVEAEQSKDIKATATALLRAVGAGIGVRTDREGVRRILGAKGKSAALLPDACLRIQMTKKQMQAAAEGAEATERAAKRLGVEYPAKGEIDREKDAIAAAKKAVSDAKRRLALDKARAKRKAAKAGAAVEAPASAPPVVVAPPVERPQVVEPLAPVEMPPPAAPTPGLVDKGEGPGLIQTTPPVPVFVPPVPVEQPPAPVVEVPQRRRRMLIVDAPSTQPPEAGPPVEIAARPSGGLIDKTPGPGLVKKEEPRVEFPRVEVPLVLPAPEPEAAPGKRYKADKPTPATEVIVPPELVGKARFEVVEEDGELIAKAWLYGKQVYFASHDTREEAIGFLNRIFDLYAKRAGKNSFRIIA